MKVAIYEFPGQSRSVTIAKAMARGIQRNGDTPIRIKIGTLLGHEPCDVAVFYGFALPLPSVMKEYVSSGRKAVHIDLGYWGRIEGGRLSGYHKVAVNSRHPDAYFQNKDFPSDRVSRFNLRVKPWKTSGKNIIVVGTSAKHARSEGLAPRQWEMHAIEELRKYTDRPILYRPKPGDKEAAPIPGVPFLRTNPIQSYFDDCWAVVSHHSNAAIEAAVDGIPSFSKMGVATAIGLNDFSKIESPIYPDNREQWLSNIAYCQWSVGEMEGGKCWNHLKLEGLV